MKNWKKNGVMKRNEHQNGHVHYPNGTVVRRPQYGVMKWDARLLKQAGGVMCTLSCRGSTMTCFAL
jgi:hypothetical protein